MAVDLENLKYQLERFYLFYRDSLKFVKPGSQSEKYRMMSMIQYSLEGPSLPENNESTTSTGIFNFAILV